MRECLLIVTLNIKKINILAKAWSDFFIFPWLVMGGSFYWTLVNQIELHCPGKNVFGEDLSQGKWPKFLLHARFYTVVNFYYIDFNLNFKFELLMCEVCTLITRLFGLWLVTRTVCETKILLIKVTKFLFS